MGQVWIEIAGAISIVFDIIKIGPQAEEHPDRLRALTFSHFLSQLIHFFVIKDDSICDSE